MAARRGPRLRLQLVLWPVLLVGADLGYRALRLAAGEAYAAGATRDEIQRLAGAMFDDLPRPEANAAAVNAGGLRSVVHPFLGFLPGGALRTHGPFAPAPEDEYTIVVLGGSVAGGFANDQRAGAAAHLTERLAEDPRFEGLHPRVVSYAYGSFKQPQQLVLLQFLLSVGFQPDAVVNIDGFNEIALAARNVLEGVHPNYPSFVKWSHRFAGASASLEERLGPLTSLAEARECGRRWAERAERFGLWRSSVLGTAALRRVRAAHRRYAAASRAYLDVVGGRRLPPEARGPRHGTDLAEGVAAGVRSWVEGSRSLAALCERRSIFYLHVLQPTLWDRGSKPLTEEELESGQAHEAWVEACRLGYPRLRERGAALAEEGVAFLDASYAFEDETETLYYDACHFGGRGNRILARRIADAFLASWDGERP